MGFGLELRARVGALALDVALEAGAGVTALVGPNGAGKTTLLRLIAGVLRPEHGVVRLGERIVFDSARGIDVPAEARRVGYVPQGYGLFPHLRVLDNVAFGLSTRAHRHAREARRRRAGAQREALGCARLAPRYPAELSAGEQQRVALARALVLEPAILLLDEPFAATDAAARRGLREHLVELLHESGPPALVVTHDARDIVALEAEVCALEDGHVVQEGTLEAVAAAPATAFLKELVGAAV